MNLAGLLNISAAVALLASSMANVEPEVERRVALYMPSEPEIVRDESFERVIELACRDYFAGSQILRVQAEAKARGEIISDLCEGREHPLSGRR